MLWGCFAGNTLGQLISVNPDDYIHTLQIGLLPFMFKLISAQTIDYDVKQVTTMREFVFMHDNSPIHRDRATKEFLERHHVNVMLWPGNSPDLNSIEHLWQHMKIGYHEEFFNTQNGYPSKSEEAMHAYIDGGQRLWSEHLGDLPRRLVSSMPKRVAAVIEAKGGHIKF